MWVDLSRHHAAERIPGVQVVRVEGGLFFANADHVRARIRRIAESGNARAVVLDAETTPSIDVTGARMLADLAQDQQDVAADHGVWCHLDLPAVLHDQHRCAVEQLQLVQLALGADSATSRANGNPSPEPGSPNRHKRRQCPASIWD